ncbi:hypothetical protein CQW23_22516 [Capsicum baccatum]|uniref:C2 domain-containing protein n=1 Tax=Capsicum baccatum TaxID=33114 RepID=A0A2G2W167_CAPBA|nr:hypothetical protein CQW23_22516 [Capsicum baccatum]
MATPPPSSRPPPKTSDLEITIVSAKHLKNVNWQNGDLRPYVIFWVDPDQRRATQSDDSGNTRPVWNERFILHLPQSPQDTVLTLEIFHSKPSDTPKPLVGTLRVPLKELVNIDDFGKVRSFELRRPSGRPHGKIKLKLGVREVSRIHDYQIVPPSGYYYSTAPPQQQQQPPPSYRTYPPASPPPPTPPSHSAHSYPYGGGYSDPYLSSSYYPGYYAQPPPPPPRPFVDRQSSYGGLGSRPSAPVDYAPPPYDPQRSERQASYGGGLGSRSSAPVDYAPPPHDQNRSGKMGVGTGLAVGAAAGALGGLTLAEGLKYEEGKIAERVENNMAARDDYSNYSVEY